MFSELGEEVKKSFEVVPAPAASPEVAELAGVIKSLAESMSAFQQSMVTEIATIKAQVAKPVVAQTDVPAPRSISPAVARSMPQSPQQPNKALSIKEIALRSTMI